MKKTEVREAIYLNLAPIFPGFRLRKADEGFVRAIQGGTQKIVIPLVDYSPIYIFSLIMCVRIDEVEDIFNLVLETPEKYRKMTLTSTTGLNYFFPENVGRKEYKVSALEDIDVAVRELSVISPNILLFFDRLRDVESMDSAMNHGDGNFDTSSQPYRAMHSLIVARLANCPIFDELVAKYVEDARNWQDNDRGRLYKLVTYLREKVTT